MFSLIKLTFNLLRENFIRSYLQKKIKYIIQICFNKANSKLVYNQNFNARLNLHNRKLNRIQNFN